MPPIGSLLPFALVFAGLIVVAALSPFAYRWVVVLTWWMRPIERAIRAYERGDVERVLRIATRLHRKRPHDEGAIYLRALARLESEEPSAVASEVRPLLPALRRPAPTALALAEAFRRRRAHDEGRYWYGVAQSDPDFATHIQIMGPEGRALQWQYGGNDRPYV
jgi:hypothetical protein